MIMQLCRPDPEMPPASFALRDRRSAWLDLRRAVGLESPAEPFNHRADDRQRLLPVSIVQEDVLPPVAAGGEVIQSARVFDAKRTGHANPVRARVKQDLTVYAAAFRAASSVEKMCSE